MKDSLQKYDIRLGTILLLAVLALTLAYIVHNTQ